MELVPFKQTDFELVISWITSDKLNYQWGGPLYDYPLTIEQIANHYAKPEVFPFVFQVDGEKAGTIEIRHIEHKQYRVCRVFIAETHRGLGLSKSLVELAVEKAKIEFGCTKLTLAVFKQNISARKCYLSLGFEEVTMNKGTRTYDGEVWDTIEMAKQL